MASADEFTIAITGRQTHGAVPWGGVDPIVIGAQIVTALQTIVSRQVNIAEAPAVVTVGKFAGGNRSNIIPDTAELVGTVRAFDEAERDENPHPHPRHRHQLRHGVGSDRQGRVRPGLSGDPQRPGADRAHGARP